MSLVDEFLNGRVSLHCGDCRDVLATLAEDSLDACVTDPPYALVSINKRFGKPGSAPAKSDGPTGVYARASSGFMQVNWDTGKTAFDPEFWQRVLRVLKPGAHLLAFGGTRTYHRLACAIEDAGFEIRDTVSWLYGSGFPKSHDVSKGIDRAAGADRTEFLGLSGRHIGPSCAGENGIGTFKELNWQDSNKVFAPATDAAREWQGWGTALKPACELIVLARKPLSEGTVAANVLRHGVGALNIDGCRVHANRESSSSGSEGENGARCPVHGLRGLRQSNAALEESSGTSKVAVNLRQEMPSRKNEGSGESKLGERELVRQQDGLQTPVGESIASVGYEATPDTHAKGVFGTSNGDGASLESGTTVAGEYTSYQWQQDRQSHRKSSSDRLEIARSGTCQDRKEDDDFVSGEPATKICTCGSASNNQATARWPANVVHDGSAEVVAAFPETASGLYKAGSTPKGERSIYGQDAAAGYATQADTYGDSGSAARFFYTAKADADDRLGSKHPTVKPLDLMQWLVRLVTPRAGVVLDPFAGTGTTGEAAWREGMSAVLIEAEPEYQADIRRRMALALSGPDERQRESIKARNLPRDDGPLFALQQAQLEQPESWAEMWAKPFDFSQEPGA